MVVYITKFSKKGFKSSSVWDATAETKEIQSYVECCGGKISTNKKKNNNNLYLMPR